MDALCQWLSSWIREKPASVLTTRNPIEPRTQVDFDEDWRGGMGGETLVRARQNGLGLLLDWFESHWQHTPFPTKVLFHSPIGFSEPPSLSPSGGTPALPALTAGL